MLEETKKAEILEYNEVNTYFLIDECGAFIWHMSHEMSHGRIPEEAIGDVNSDIENVREIQKFAVDNLMRFGVDPKSSEDRKNGDYWKWYRFWDNWKKELTNEEWENVSDALKNNKSFDKYLPKTTWKN